MDVFVLLGHVRISFSWKMLIFLWEPFIKKFKSFLRTDKRLVNIKLLWCGKYSLYKVSNPKFLSVVTIQEQGAGIAKKNTS